MTQKKYLSLERLVEYDTLIKAKINEGDETILSSAKSYADGGDATTLASAKTYVDEQIAVIPTQVQADYAQNDESAVDYIKNKYISIPHIYNEQILNDTSAIITINVEDLENGKRYGFTDIKDGYAQYNGRNVIFKFVVIATDGTEKQIGMYVQVGNITFWKYDVVNNKINLHFGDTDYYYVIDVSSRDTSSNIVVTKKIKYLAISNTTEYTPISNYAPATKKYVDDSISALSDTYYTETEIDTKLSTIDNSIANITSGTVVVKEAEHADSADEATHATTADNATKATQDAEGNVITETYQTIIDDELETTDKTIVGAINELNSVSYVIPPYEVVNDEWSSLAYIDIMQLEVNKFYYVPNDVFDTTKSLQGLKFIYIADDGTVKTIYQGKPSIYSFYLSSKSNNGVVINMHDETYSYIASISNHDTAENITVKRVAKYLPIISNKDYLSNGGIYVPTQNNDPANKKYVDDSVANIDLSTYETTENAQLKLDEAKAYADSVKNDLLNGAGTAYDTLKELGDLIDVNVDAIEALETVASGKADKVHNHTIEDVENLQTTLDNISSKANESDVFIVNVTGNATNGYTADKTFAEISEAFENDKYVYALCSGLKLDLLQVNSKAWFESFSLVNMTRFSITITSENVVNVTSSNKSATQYMYGGVKAAAKSDTDTVEAKIGTDGKLYVPTYPSLDAYYTEIEVDAKLEGKAENDHIHDNATTTDAGFMTPEMVAKLDGIEEGATKVIVDADLSTTSTNAVQNKVVNAAIQGVLDVASANTTAINGHNDRIVALESKVGDGFVEITSAEIQALFA